MVVVVDCFDICSLEVVLAWCDKVLSGFVRNKVPCIAKFDGMSERASSQVAIDEGRDSPDRLETKPEEKILWAITTIDRNDLLRLDTKVVHQPIADSVDAVEELLVGPRTILKDQKQVVAIRTFGMAFENMVKQRFAFHEAFSDEFDGIFGLWQRCSFQIMANQKLAI